MWASNGLFVESQLSKTTSYMRGTWYTCTQVLLCTCFVLQGSTFFDASYVLVLSTSTTGSHGQSSGKISIPARRFGSLHDV